MGVLLVGLDPHPGAHAGQALRLEMGRHLEIGNRGSEFHRDLIVEQLCEVVVHLHGSDGTKPPVGRRSAPGNVQRAGSL